MDFDLSSIVGCAPGGGPSPYVSCSQQMEHNNLQELQPPTPSVMHSLVMSPINPVHPEPAQANMLWPTGDEFNPLPFNDITTVGTLHVTEATAHAPELAANNGGGVVCGAVCGAGNHIDTTTVDRGDITTVGSMVETETLGTMNKRSRNSKNCKNRVKEEVAPQMRGRKRRYQSVCAKVESEGEVSKEGRTFGMESFDGNADIGNETGSGGTSQVISHLISGGPPTDIDPHVVCQMGGLAFAELCKERAREQFKERKKSEHLANGKFHRLKRRKKNDTSMSEKEKYDRRLQMNQDSAAAARYAHEVYIQVLEKLVKMSEEERRTFSIEMQRIREQNEHLQCKVEELECKVEELLAEESGDGALDSKQADPSLAKIIDLLKGPSTISVEYGVQPARAV